MSKDIFDYVMENNISEVKLLLDYGADVNAKNDNGETALDWTSVTGHIEPVKLLLEYGADVNVKNNYGSTPLACPCIDAQYKGVSPSLSLALTSAPYSIINFTICNCP